MPRLLADIVFPRICTICGEPVESESKRHYFCIECLAGLPFAGNSDEIYLRMTETLTESGIYFDKAIALFDRKRDERIIDAIYDLKYIGLRRVGRELGFMLGELIVNDKSDLPDFLQPVPLHPAKFRQRGFNQASEIAKGISEIIDVPVVEKADRVVNTSTQTKLSVKQRARNVDNIFRLNGKDAKGNVMIVDDVMTTGATVNNLAKAFREARYGNITAASAVLA